MQRPLLGEVSARNSARFASDSLARVRAAAVLCAGRLLTIFGMMIGTLQLARALTDRDLSDQLLQGVETALRLLNDRA